LLYLNHCEGVPYTELIARYKHVLSINLYNISNHFARHVEQKDIEEVDRLKAEWSGQQDKGVLRDGMAREEG